MKINPWFPLFIAAALAAGVYIGVKIGKRIPYVLENTTPSTGNSSLDEIIRYVNARYVDDVPQDSLVGKAIEQLLGNLDPHSAYIPSKNLEMVNDQLDGDFEGIGVEYLLNEDTITIISTVPGGPSEQVGIISGDKIVSVEDSIVAGVKITSEKIIGKLRGHKGTKVKVGVLRGRQLLSMVITRDEIPNHSVDAGFMLDAKTGYIKVNRFAENTYKEFMEKLDPMIEKQGMKDLVIDLRGNPGGYVQKAVDILNQCFKDKDKLLLYTEGKHSHKQEYKTNGQAFYNIENISVLIDEGSASASEIVAGALQDWDRAKIIGRRSFGKGLVQEQYPLSDGSALRLTIARYYTPSGRCIQKPYKGNKNYDDDIETRFKSGELSDEAKNANQDTIKFQTASGRTVRGGGGISPDVFVPIEAALLNDYFVKIRAHIPSFAIAFAQNNKNSLPPNVNDFIYKSLDNNTLQNFISFCESKGVAKNNIELAKCQSLLETMLKARIGKIAYNDEAQYRILANNDAMVAKALGK
jgi:carboxyl-terminal processing protease